MLASRSRRATVDELRKTSWTASPCAQDGLPAIVSYHGWSKTMTSPGVVATRAMNWRPAAASAAVGSRCDG